MKSSFSLYAVLGIVLTVVVAAPGRWPPPDQRCNTTTTTLANEDEMDDAAVGCGGGSVRNMTLAELAQCFQDPALLKCQAHKGLWKALTRKVRRKIKAIATKKSKGNGQRFRLLFAVCYLTYTTKSFRQYFRCPNPPHPSGTLEVRLNTTTFMIHYRVGNLTGDPVKLHRDWWTRFTCIRNKSANCLYNFQPPSMTSQLPPSAQSLTSAPPTSSQQPPFSQPRTPPPPFSPPKTSPPSVLPMMSPPTVLPMTSPAPFSPPTTPLLPANTPAEACMQKAREHCFIPCTAGATFQEDNDGYVALFVTECCQLPPGQATDDGYPCVTELTCDISTGQLLDVVADPGQCFSVPYGLQNKRTDLTCDNEEVEYWDFQCDIGRIWA